MSSTPAIARCGGHDGPSRAVASVRGCADESAQAAASDDAPGEAPSVQHMRDLLLPFAACSSARTALISAEEAAMVDDAARSLATRIRAVAAEKRARERGEAAAQVASASVYGAAKRKEQEGERARRRGTARAILGGDERIVGIPMCRPMRHSLAPAALRGL